MKERMNVKMSVVSTMINKELVFSDSPVSKGRESKVSFCLVVVSNHHSNHSLTSLQCGQTIWWTVTPLAIGLAHSHLLANENVRLVLAAEEGARVRYGHPLTVVDEIDSIIFEHLHQTGIGLVEHSASLDWMTLGQLAVPSIVQATLSQMELSTKVVDSLEIGCTSEHII